MNDLDIREGSILDKLKELREDIEAIQQPRSDYAIEKFVIGQHMTPGRQRMQAVLELQIKMFNIQSAQLDIEEIENDIKEIELQTVIGETPVDRKRAEIKLQRKQLEMQQINLARMGNLREAEALYAILQRLPRYTADQYQEEEEIYWTMRLAEQAELSARNTGAIGIGNMEALRQVGRGIVTSVDPDKLASASLNTIGLLGD